MIKYLQRLVEKLMKNLQAINEKVCKRENEKMLKWSQERVAHHKERLAFYQKCEKFYQNFVDK